MYVHDTCISSRMNTKSSSVSLNQYLGKNPNNNLYQEAGPFLFFSLVEYLQACAFFVLALAFLEMFLKGIS